MNTAFQLRWVEGEEARMNHGGEWQLRFRDHAAYEFAKKRLDINLWQGIRHETDEEKVFVFIPIPEKTDPKANMVAAGIPANEISHDGV